MSKLILFFKNLYKFIRYDIWRITEYELTQTRKFTYRTLKTIVISIRGFINNRLNAKASALTYSILFAAIPCVALLLAISKGFGVENYIKNWLLSSFSEHTEIIPNLMEFVERYLDTARGGFFIGIGIVILLWSVMNFFMQVENAFNDIWQVKKSRSVVRQFTIYFSTILILPVLIVASSGLSIYIQTIFSQSILYESIISPIMRFGVKLAPFVLNWIIFTLLYLLIPNTKVRFVNALVAGIFTGTVFQLFQALYISGQINLSRYNIVYGSFAAIPLLLLWLRISCLIVLLGAEISYAMQNTHFFEYETDTKNISRRYKDFITVFLTHVVVKQFEEQQPALSSEDIARKYNLPIRMVNQLLIELVDVGILISVYDEKMRTKTYQPAFDINKLTFYMLFEKLESHGAEMFLTSRKKELDGFWQKTVTLREQCRESFKDVLIKDMDLSTKQRSA
jgi:membrane protein